MTPRLQERYLNEIAPALKEELKISNPMRIPRLMKVTLNIGVGEGSRDVKLVEAAARDLEVIAGQKPVITRARRSIATFKLREGMAIGTMVTLRRAHMWEFLDRLLNIALPRVRDFRGLNPRGFDGRGNYSMGIREQIIFPEIEYDKIDRVRGMNISVSTTAEDDQAGFALLKHLGFPFRK